MPQAKPTVPLADEKHPLVMENAGLAYRYAQLHPVPYLPFEEVAQICLMALTRAARTFDARKARFSTYAFRAMKMDLYRIYKDRSRYKRGSFKVPVQMPVFKDGAEIAFTARPDPQGESERLRDYLEGLIDRLADERQRFVLRQRFFQKLTLDQVAIQIGVTKEAVRQVQVKSLGELRAMIEWEERGRRRDRLDEMKAGELDWEAFVKMAG